MHGEPFNFVGQTLRRFGPRKSVLEIGSRDINGSIRSMFPPGMMYVGLDIVEGPGVDIVADASNWANTGPQFDTVISTECLEHTWKAEQICLTAWESLDIGGLFIVTAAGEGRNPHNANGDPWGANEYYGNVTRRDLEIWLEPFGAYSIDTSIRGDIYAWAVKALRY